jgi:hypothetical protein
MKWRPRKILRLYKADLIRVYEDIGMDVGTALFSKSSEHENCSINHEDFKVAYYLKIESVLFQNKREEQQLVSFERAIWLYNHGDQRDSPERYVVISWSSIMGEDEFPDKELPF